MTRPLLLDLFCGAGGAAVGYHRAGFDVVGVDHRPMPRYPYSCCQEDALAVLERLADGKTWRGYRINDFAVIHASPPCQRYTRASFAESNREKHPDLIGITRQILQDLAVPYVIENVDGAPMQQAVQLCGQMFGLGVFRHRWFECSHLVMIPPHPSHRGKKIGVDGMCCVVGHGGGTSRRLRDFLNRQRRHGAGGQQNKPEWQAAMGINWMTRNELSQAIPPAYTEFIGRQLLRALGLESEVPA